MISRHDWSPDTTWWARYPGSTPGSLWRSLWRAGWETAPRCGVLVQALVAEVLACSIFVLAFFFTLDFVVPSTKKTPLEISPCKLWHSDTTYCVTLGCGRPIYLRQIYVWTAYCAFNHAMGLITPEWLRQFWLTIPLLWTVTSGVLLDLWFPGFILFLMRTCV